MLSPSDIVNPRNLTRAYVHPDALPELIKQFNAVRAKVIHVGGFKIRIVENKNMPQNVVWFRGKSFRLTGGETVDDNTTQAGDD